MTDLKNMPHEEIVRRRKKAYDGRTEVGRMKLISEAQRVVEEYNASLSAMDRDDPRFAGMLAAYETAIERRNATERRS